jgi:hypothetical protein
MQVKLAVVRGLEEEESDFLMQYWSHLELMHLLRFLIRKGDCMKDNNSWRWCIKELA